MDFKILWTPEATACLNEIVHFIAQDNPTAAIKMGDKILDRIQSLSDFPELGKIFRGTNRADVREIPAKPYRIIYQVLNREKTVKILSIWHGARQEPEIR
ncbi:MAG: type II toxin-antitoxin system RelE/ParE family toxin [Limisphaerales bacterium]